MATDADPIPESWYQHTDKGQEFQVIDVDKDAEVIEIQYFDGSVEEIDLNEWYQLEIEPTEEPENWSGALDIAEVDDLGTSVTDTDSDDWNAPLQEIHQHEPEEQDPDLTELNDEWGDGTGEEEPWKEP